MIACMCRKKVKKVLTFNVEFVTVVWKCKMSTKKQ